MEFGMFVSWVVVGLLAGWLAGFLMQGGGYGLIGDLGLGLVGSGCRYEACIPPDFRRARSAGARLFWSHFFHVRMGCSSRRTNEHGRSDQRRRAAGVQSQHV